MASYQEIAAQLRSRIERGLLRPGDRVPSTRAITREWGVAIATASKALAALQADGLVRSVVGVGTVVADRPQGTVAGPARRNQREAETVLTRERIVRTAVAVADAEGLAAVTMRRLATELDVAVMSLYRHVPGKNELVAAMVDYAFGEAALPDPAPAGWRERLEAVLRVQWAMNTRHPWLASATSLIRPPLVPNGMAFTEAHLRVIRELGFDGPTALKAVLALIGFLLGVGVSQQLDAEAERETGLTHGEFLESQGELFAQLAADRFPMLLEVSTMPDFDLRLDDVVDFGVGLMLDGLAQRIPAQKRVRSSRSMPRSAS